MKKTITILALALLSAIALAQTPKNAEYKFIEASELNLIGKLFPDTPNPYHRVDTIKYKGFTAGENYQVRCSAGIAVLFKTNATSISVMTKFSEPERSWTNTMAMSYRGYDLYIKKNGEWLWAASGVTNAGPDSENNKILIKDMDKSEKECMLYLPIYSEIQSVKIGIEKEADIERMESPFRHRIALFGSSFSHGISTSRAGMSYPMQFMRHTGLQILNLGCSGNCKMQPYFADVLCDADVDAIVFDCFSNPDAEMIRERTFPFIERIRKAYPDIPLIFQQTIYRESRNFNLKRDQAEREKQAAAEEVMAKAMKKYKNIYFIKPDATDKKHETSVDGTHPGNCGYSIWADSIEKPILKILRKYGIK